jgi:hypothetical protein
MSCHIPHFSPLRLPSNPLIRAETVQAVRLEELTSPTLCRRDRSARREFRDLRRNQSAREAIGGLDHRKEIYGFTKGQFSLLDLLNAAIEQTGPVRFSLSTWTAARHEIQALAKLRDEGQLLSMRWLCDLTFVRRDPEAAFLVRKTFGMDAIRVAQVHAKFALFENDDWRLVLRTSMNLNMNPRFEDFTLAHDPPLADWLKTILDEIWRKQRRSLAAASPGEVRRHFLSDL